MTKKQGEELELTKIVWYRESPEFRKYAFQGTSDSILKKIHRAETTLHRIAENQCNGHPMPAFEDRGGKIFKYTVEDVQWKERDEKTEKRLEKKIKAIADELGFKVDFNGDPRGGAIRFTLPSGNSNNWDGETWGVYW